MIDNDILTCVKETSEILEIDPALILSIVQVESAGNRFAIRYEPQFRYLTEVSMWAKNVGSTLLTEELGQKTSWGLMQIMGATAREFGFDSHFPKLCEIDHGIMFGSVYLSHHLKKWENTEDAIASYNAGSPRKIGSKYENQSYVDKVLFKLDLINKNGGI